MQISIENVLKQTAAPYLNPLPFTTNQGKFTRYLGRVHEPGCRAFFISEKRGDILFSGLNTMGTRTFLVVKKGVYFLGGL